MNRLKLPEKIAPVKFSVLPSYELKIGPSCRNAFIFVAFLSHRPLLACNGSKRNSIVICNRLGSSDRMFAGLMDGPQGFDSSRAVWKDAGWREVKDLRKALERMRELTNLVRSLGRSSGKGALKRAPQQVSIGQCKHRCRLWQTSRQLV